MPRLPESLAVLRQREYRLLLSAHAVSLFGDGMAGVALAFAVLEIGGSAADIGLVLGCRALALAGCLLAGGVVADRTSRRAVMVRADVARTASQGASAALLLTGTAEIWALAALAAVAGAAAAFSSPAATGLLPTVVAPEQLQQANGLRATATAAGRVLGPLAAGVLVVATGPGWALATDAVTFAISAALLSRLRLRPHLAARAGSFLGDLRAGWAAFRSRTWVWSVVVSLSVANAVFGAWSVLGPVVAERDLGGAAAWGTVVAAMAAGALAGGLLSIRARLDRPLVGVALAASVAAAPLALLAASAGLVPLALAAVPAGAGVAISNAVWEATLQRHVPGGTLSRVSAYDRFGSLALVPAGLAAWGAVAAAAGVSTALWLAATLYVVAALAPLAIPSVRRLTALPLSAYPRRSPD